METPKVETRQCARCPRPLGPANNNKDKLCGYCQQEIKTDGPRYEAWVAGGKKREVQRCERCNKPEVAKDNLCEGCSGRSERARHAIVTRHAQNGTTKNGNGKHNGQHKKQHALDAIHAITVSKDPAMMELRVLVRRYGITRLALNNDGKVTMERSYVARGTL